MSKYKVGDKVVLEITDKVEVTEEPWYILSDATSIFESYLDKAAEPLTNYTKLLEEYINDLLLANGRLSKEKEDCAEQARANGAEAAWELVRKIVKMKLFDYKEIFNSQTLRTAINMTYPEAAAKVEAWEKAKAKPQKTMMQDFLEKFPKAELNSQGTPYGICPSYLGYKTPKCNFGCVECWNRPLEQIGEEK